MKVVEKIEPCRTWLKEQKQARLGKAFVGFVPTMGYLHEGHASLLAKAQEDNDIVVVSIFVNPLQFGPTEDLDRYPRDREGDLALCAKLGVDLVFIPDTKEMYGNGSVLTHVHVEALGDHLCGASRPGHFDGVCTVVSKLFHIIEPSRAYFGKKDAQQWRIIKRMVDDLSMDVQIIPCPIVRETDGLAKSSRNAYLTPKQRTQAVVLYEALQRVLHKFLEGESDVGVPRSIAMEKLTFVDQLKLDYLAFVDASTLAPVNVIEDNCSVLCAVAAYFGTTRLIDNIELAK